MNARSNRALKECPIYDFTGQALGPDIISNPRLRNQNTRARLLRPPGWLCLHKKVAHHKNIQ